MPTAALSFAHRLAGPPLLRLLRPLVEGREHLPRRGGMMYAANHVSNLDNYLLSAASPRPVLFLGKRELATGLFGAFNLAMGMVPVERGAADRSAIDRLVRLVTAGEIVAFFPEGTRSPTGELFRFRSGVARVAHAAGVPVVPVGLRGTARVWPRDRAPALRRPEPHTLQVRFGSPLPAPGDGSGPARRRWTEQLRACVAALSGQATAEAFAPVE